MRFMYILDALFFMPDRMFKRTLKTQIKNDFFSGKIIVLLWPRQVGKTTLINELLGSYDPSDIMSFNGDNNLDREILSENNLQKSGGYIAHKKIIFIDEAQKIPNIWNTLKIFIDTYKATKQIIVTGSSSLNLLDKTREPLTGRKVVYQLFPISVGELLSTYDVREVNHNLENLLIFGSYPAVVKEKSIQGKIWLLEELSNASLYRDILEFQQIKNSQIILKLLKLLALQLGKEVAMSELATNLGIDKGTVERYIDILEKSFIIFRLPPYFTNKRKELNKANKVYFYDVGMRNAVIGGYDFLENRKDVGDLWENFLIVERMKKQAYTRRYGHNYFRRTYNQVEIDFIEEVGGKMSAFECKRSKKNARVPAAFAELYPESSFEVINRENFLDFVL